MGNHIYHRLINPNQLRYYDIKVQENPMLETALSIITEENELCMELVMAGTVVYAETFTPSGQELHQCPHIIISLTHAWNPQNVVFLRARITSEEEMGTLRHVSSMDSTGEDNENEDIIEDMVFSIDQINRKLYSLKRLELVKPSIYPGKSDVPITHAFKISDRHLDVTAQDLSERRGISIPNAAKKIKKTTQKFRHIAVLPLSRRYRTNRVFTRETLQGDWSMDTMYSRFK